MTWVGSGHTSTLLTKGKVSSLMKSKSKSSKKHESVRSETKVEQLWTKDEEEEETKTKRRWMMIGEVASLPEK